PLTISVVNCRMILLSKDLFSRSTAARSRATFRRRFRPDPGLPVRKALGGADIHARYRPRCGDRGVVTRSRPAESALPRGIGLCGGSIKPEDPSAKAQWQAPAEAAILAPWPKQRPDQWTHPPRAFALFRCARSRRTWSRSLQCAPD